MNQTIWKFQLPFEELTTLQLPKRSEILCVQIDGKTENPCLWVLVYPENIKEERSFELFGTGIIIRNDMAIGRRYIGTFQVSHGLFVGHLFERTSL